LAQEEEFEHTVNRDIEARVRFHLSYSSRKTSTSCGAPAGFEPATGDESHVGLYRPTFRMVCVFSETQALGTSGSMLPTLRSPLMAPEPYSTSAKGRRSSSASSGGDRRGQRFGAIETPHLLLWTDVMATRQKKRPKIIASHSYQEHDFRVTAGSACIRLCY
jgi:hypothetical protein